MNKIIECFLMGICSCAFCNAQQAISTAGAEASGAGGTVSYTIGQVAFSTQTGSTGSVTEGVQQPYEIFEVTGIEAVKGISLEFTVYPNPAFDFLTLKIESCKIENLNYQLFNVSGTLIQNREIVGKETIIRMGNLVPANYYLRVYDTDKEVKTFKIVKN